MKATLKYDPSSTQRKGVLGVLEGVCADTIRSTRNGRKYSEKLWETVFQDEIVQEYFRSGGLLGELNHPVDREETDLEKVAICMPEPPVKNDAGQLIGRWDILDTPNGRILKCLCDYGYKIGISSRGSGDIVEDWNGEDIVDPETYKLEGFDAVIIPAVPEARPDYVPVATVTESFVATKGLKKALVESYNRATDDEKRVMSETLKSLDIDYKVSSNVEEEDAAETAETAVNNGALVEELQQALKDNAALNSNIATLQEKLSVSYAKEIQQSEDIAKLKSAVVKLSESAQKSNSLQEQLSRAQKSLKEAMSRCSQLEEALQASKRRLKVESNARANLTESLEKSHLENTKDSARLKALTERYEKQQKANNDKITSLTEKLEAVEADAQVQAKAFAKRLESSKNLIETYKKQNSTILEHYISNIATTLGVSVNEIKNRLPKNATVQQVDSICEELRNYKLNMSRLPFAINASTVTKIAKVEDTSNQRNQNPDDDVDASLLDAMNM